MVKRRTLLAALAASGVSGLAGCGGSSSEDGTPSDSDSGSPGATAPSGETPEGTSESTPTVTPTATVESTPSRSEVPDSARDSSSSLAASDGDEGDRFGWSVGLSADGTTLLVGAYLDEDPNGSQSGAAYVFQQASAGWIQEAKLVPNDGGSEDLFGTAAELSPDGERAVVGAQGENAVYVFDRDGSQWTQQAKFSDPDNDDISAFGCAIGLANGGQTALVGARAKDPGAGSAAGAAYVFEESGGWRQQAELLADDRGPGDVFGVDVGLSADGKTAIVGALMAPRAYVFTRSNGSWTQQTRFAPDDESNDAFGRAVALSDTGSVALVDGGNGIHLYLDGDSWSRDRTFAPDAERSASLGENDGSLALTRAGRVAFIGSENAAYAYQYDPQEESWSEAVRFAPADDAPTLSFGDAVAVSDRAETLVVGDRGADESGNNSGVAYVFKP